MLINKFNQDMRDLVLQTENTDSLPPTPTIEKRQQNYVAEITQKIEMSIQNQNRPNVLDFKKNETPRQTLFKKHKSLPVSPVTEDGRLSDFKTDCVNSNVDLSKKQNYGFYVGFQNRTRKEKRKVKDDEEENFSSDSLEDGDECDRVRKKGFKQSTSNYDIFQEKQNNFNITRSSSTLLKRVTSSNESINIENQDCYISELSHSRESVLSEKSEAIEPYDIYPEYERHSSASFYLRNVPASASQESILSNFSESADYSWKMNEEYSLADKLSRTNCNSLESVLSDESIDTQSAPLEVLFRTHRRRKVSETEEKIVPSTPIEQNYVQRTLTKFEPELTSSKSFHILDYKKNDRMPLQENINRNSDNIPTMQSKNDQYERKGSEFWMSNKVISKSKSCCFEVLFDHSNDQDETKRKSQKLYSKSLDRNKPTTSKHITTNVQTTNKAYTTQSLDRSSTQMSTNLKVKRDGFELLIGDVVKHKPPKGMRRSVSTRLKKTNKILDERRNSDSFTQIRNFNKTSTFLNDDENTVNLNYYEPSNKIGVCEEIDPNIAEREFEKVKIPEPATPFPTIKNEQPTKIENLKYLSTEDITKFRDIERKIEMINKLVEIEEQKITKGKVKRLSKIFEQSQPIPPFVNTVSTINLNKANSQLKISKLPIKTTKSTFTESTKWPQTSSRSYLNQKFNSIIKDFKSNTKKIKTNIDVIDKKISSGEIPLKIQKHGHFFCFDVSNLDDY